MHKLKRLFVACSLVLLTVGNGLAQVRRPVPVADKDSGAFDSKFFDDLRSLFGRLEQTELDRAFRLARTATCSDLVSEKGEWKEVGFLNDDRSLGDWHHDNLDEVKRDLTAFVFSGTCRSERGPVKVATSYAVQETFDKYRAGKIPESQVVINDNDPVSVIFDVPLGVYIFQLPFLYLESKDRTGDIYTLNPPLLSSRPDRTVAEEFRCKALNDADLTYRFLLCRTRVVQQDVHRQQPWENQPRGNSAYYILSDGKEAHSTVRLSFGDAVDPTPGKDENSSPAVEDSKWQAPAAESRLVDLASAEFHLRFDPATWTGHIDKPQLIAGQAMADFIQPPAADSNREYCVWRPGPAVQARQVIGTAGENVLYGVTFRKDLQSPPAAIFELENRAGSRVGTLQCYFPQTQSPAEITVARWMSIVGKTISLEVPQR